MAQQVVDPATAAKQEQRLVMTYDEFLEWAADIHAEWVNGEVIVFMSPNDKHRAIIGLLYKLMSIFAELFDLGGVRFAPFEMRAIPDGPAREPHLLFISREHLDRLTPQRLAGPADFVVEVVSESSASRDRTDKFFEYQEAGIPEYWLIDSRAGKERVDGYRLMADGKYLAILPDERGRYHSTVLPGFWFDPAWLWQEPLPHALPLLAAIAPQALRAALQAPDANSSQGRA